MLMGRVGLHLSVKGLLLVELLAVLVPVLVVLALLLLVLLLVLLAMDKLVAREEVH